MFIKTNLKRWHSKISIEIVEFASKRKCLGMPITGQRMIDIKQVIYEEAT